MADRPPRTFKPAKDRRKPSRGRRVTVTDEARAAYEETMRARDERERERGRFLPDTHKGKR